MTDYKNLVKFLRGLSPWAFPEASNKRMQEAAYAIEELQQKWFKSETDATNLTGKLAQAEADIERLNLEIDKRIATEIELSNQVDALQAEVERLKDSNEELREKQTYIDHYGDTWMTSAKDVPTEAYKHGYADGWDEARAKARAKMEVQG